MSCYVTVPLKFPHTAVAGCCLSRECHSVCLCMLAFVDVWIHLCVCVWASKEQNLGTVEADLVFSLTSYPLESRNSAR